MAGFKALIFDLDGTLVHTYPDVAAAVNAGRQAMGRDKLADVEIRKAIGPGKQTFLDILMPGAQPDDQQAFLDHFREHYVANCLRFTRLFEGMQEVLDAAGELKLAVATNKPRSTSVKILDGLGVLPKFEAVLGPEDVKEAKPHPEMIEKILAALNVAPHEAVMIGDTANDMLAGRAAGTAVAAAFWGYGKREELETHRPDFPLEVPGDIQYILSYK